jgi:hypothetical protein
MGILDYVGNPKDLPWLSHYGHYPTWGWTLPYFRSLIEVFCF